MRRIAVGFVSIAVVVACGWAWRRSFHHIDLIAFVWSDVTAYSVSTHPGGVTLGHGEAGRLHEEWQSDGMSEANGFTANPLHEGLNRRSDKYPNATPPRTTDLTAAAYKDYVDRIYGTAYIFEEVRPHRWSIPSHWFAGFGRESMTGTYHDERRRTMTPFTFFEVYVPFWFLAAVLGVGPVGFAVLLSRYHRHRLAGRCTACGYDLRASPERCPECGRAVTGAA